MIKKQLIMEKALELFAIQGIEATPIQQITDYCGISKGAFYLAFKSKDELIIALIDHFMIQIISDIDYTVKNTQNKQELLFSFFQTTFQSFHTHANFAKIFMKEQSHSFNKELINKMRHYDRLMDEIILSLIEQIYGDRVIDTKYDLIYTIKGLMNSYSAFFILNKGPIDIDLLSQSLAEKTNLIATNTTTPFISKEMMEIFKLSNNDENSKEQISEILLQKIEELDESTEKESLILLNQHVLETSLHPAIVQGLLKNIQNHPHCKGIAYILSNYFMQDGGINVSSCFS
ncbi:AcrR family transcriptional regulator [Cytobacillus eiseniae]|uniref:AcrR family transcriptional regulator n=1 Tax=Cytobacillus eiseniae TaxID=762947 RepID=A0ABS4RF34_9BACI|nr:TetR/AcrR family transcriptional regulator [Cytobacillus eiseniae]MBP2241506.1 AcrR family transcriptional regulator [Cytobacillus eiseniae]